MRSRCNQAPRRYISQLEEGVHPVHRPPCSRNIQNRLGSGVKRIPYVYKVFHHAPIRPDKGKIVQKGIHSSLLSQDGMYKEIFELQTYINDRINKEIE